MKKKFASFIPVLAGFSILFSFCAPAFADTQGGTLNSPVVTTVGTAGQAVFTGTVNQAALSELGYNSAFHENIVIALKYGKIPTDGTAATLSSNVTCTSDESNGCTLSSGIFSTTIGNLLQGSYAYDFGVLSTFSDTGSSTFTSFLPQGTLQFAVNLVLPYASFGSASVSGTNATVTVNGYNVPVPVQAYLQLGTATEVGATAQYTCTPGSIQSPAIRVTAGAGPIPVSYTFTGLASNNYCIRVIMQMPGYTTTQLVPVGTGSSVDSQGYWEAPGALFSVGTATLHPGATNNPAASPTGCITKPDNSNYCLLAPLPGIGDQTGSLNVSTGVGPFLKTIIQIVMGIIGVLSVLMITIGGIEYMTTVNIGEKEGARSRIMNAIFGLLLALGSYIILNTINPSLVNLGVVVPSAVVTLGEDQGVETAETGTLPATKATETGVTIPTGTAQALAQQILNDSTRITLDGQWGQNDSSSTPIQNIKDTAAGTAASTSQAASSQLGSVEHNPLSANMLAGMLAVSQVTPITITAIEGSVHSGAGSKHYLGRAFDIQANQSDSASSLALDKTIGDACDYAGASLVITPCAGNESSGFCSATGYATNTGHKTHIHCEWPS